MQVEHHCLVDSRLYAYAVLDSPFLAVKEFPDRQLDKDHKRLCSSGMSRTNLSPPPVVISRPGLCQDMVASSLQGACLVRDKA